MPVWFTKIRSTKPGLRTCTSAAPCSVGATTAVTRSACATLPSPTRAVLTPIDWMRSRVRVSGAVPGGTAPGGTAGEGFIGVGALPARCGLPAVALEETEGRPDVDGAGASGEVTDAAMGGGPGCFDAIGSRFM